MEFDTKKAENNFISDISDSITRSCNEAIKNCDKRGNPVEEPDLIAHIIEQLPRDLYNSLHAYSASFIFNVTGVFCHQKPLADFGNIPCPELGDLLLIYIEEDQNTEKRCNSLLLQAKKVINSTYTIYRNEEHQLKLYKEWPTFKYKRAGILNGTIRNIVPKSINIGAQYLMMKAPYDDEKLYGCAIPSKTIVFGNKLSQTILSLLEFSTGRAFDYKHPVDDDWTNMIWDLIDIARTTKFNRRNSGIVGKDRLFYETYGETDGETDDWMLKLVDEYLDANQIENEEGIMPMILIQGKNIANYEEWDNNIRRNR